MSTSETITRTDLTNILNDILPVYNSTGFTVEKITASSATSVSANGGTAWIQVRIPSGYEPVCIVGYYLNGGSGCSVYNEAIAKDSNGYYCSFALRNGQSSVNTVTIDAYVLCKQSLTHFTQAMADYIVEQGTSGIWTYRKWNSGIAEFWGYYSKTVAISASGHVAITPPAFPFTTANPSVFVSYQTVLSTGTGTDIYWRNLSGSAFNNTAWVFMSVKGEWK